MLLLFCLSDCTRGDEGEHEEKKAKNKKKKRAYYYAKPFNYTAWCTAVGSFWYDRSDTTER